MCTMFVYKSRGFQALPSSPPAAPRLKSIAISWENNGATNCTIILILSIKLLNAHIIQPSNCTFGNLPYK